uniref:Uncharacterized protein n=1 Tax=Nelumbo nucifera TaxID=4432 RepID=A0A822ZT17_NELNU|nr:TPA_asm: hypothetical protein HUJ06_018991 [Nelumbo nucifera]
MRNGSLNTKLKLSLPSPDETFIAQFLTQSGTFRDGDLLVNKDGVRVVPKNEAGEHSIIMPSDNQLTLDDIDTIKVIGKGNGGILQLVQHKWTQNMSELRFGDEFMRVLIRRKINEVKKKVPTLVTGMWILDLKYQQHLMEPNAWKLE